MLSPQTGALAPDPPGLLDPTQPHVRLRPGVLLHRLQPVRLAAVVRQVQHYHRTIQGLRLLEQHFPDELDAYDKLAGVGWWEILAALVNRVGEADYFEVDWDSLNLAWAHMHEDDHQDGQYMARFLQFIPVKLYGFTPHDLPAFPPIELMRALLNDPFPKEVSTDLLTAVEIYDGLSDWTEADRETAWERLRAIEADPGRFPPPVRWLPELARWACGRTGNFILDQSFDLNRGPWLSWHNDLEQVRTAWRRARPVIDQFHRLIDWVEADPSRLTLLTYALMEGTHYDHLEW